MPLTPVRALEIGVIALATLGAAGAYVESRVTSARADAAEKANKTLEQQLQQMRDDVDKRIAARDVQYQQASADMQKQFQGSLQQILAVVGQRANLPIPLQVIQPTPTPGNPNPTPQVVVPSADLPAARSYIQDCEQCKLDRDKLQLNAEDRIKQMQLAQQQIDALKGTNEQLVKAAHGTFFGNLKKTVKWVIIGALSGAAAVCATGHCK